MRLLAPFLDWVGRGLTALAVLAAGVTGYQTYLDRQPYWVVALVAAAVFMFISSALLIWRGRWSTIGKTDSFEELRAQVRNKRLAELRGEEDAERKLRSERRWASSILGGGVAHILEEQEDIRRARHRARVKRIEQGAEE